MAHYNHQPAENQIEVARKKSQVGVCPCSHTGEVASLVLVNMYLELEHDT